MLKDYLTILQRISSNAKDVSKFAPKVEIKALELAESSVTAIATQDKIGLVGSNNSIRKLTQEAPKLQKELYKEIINQNDR